MRWRLQGRTGNRNIEASRFRANNGQALRMAAYRRTIWPYVDPGHDTKKIQRRHVGRLSGNRVIGHACAADGPCMADYGVPPNPPYVSSYPLTLRTSGAPPLASSRKT